MTIERKPEKQLSKTLREIETNTAQTPVFASIVNPEYSWTELDTGRYAGVCQLPSTKGDTRAVIRTPEPITPGLAAVRVHEMLHAKFTPDIMRHLRKLENQHAISNAAKQYSEDLRITYLGQDLGVWDDRAAFDAGTLELTYGLLPQFPSIAQLVAFGLSWIDQPVTTDFPANTRSLEELTKDHPHRTFFESESIEKAQKILDAVARRVDEIFADGAKHEPRKAAVQSILIATAFEDALRKGAGKTTLDSKEDSKEAPKSENQGESLGQGDSPEGDASDNSDASADANSKSSDDSGDSEASGGKSSAAKGSSSNPKKKSDLPKAIKDALPPKTESKSPIEELPTLSDPKPLADIIARSEGEITRKIEEARNNEAQAIKEDLSQLNTEPPELTNPLRDGAKNPLTTNEGAADSKDKERQLLSQIAQKLSKLTGEKGDAGGGIPSTWYDLDPKLHTWPGLRIDTPPLARHFKAIVPRRGSPNIEGHVPKHLNRWFDGRRIMQRRGRNPGGTLLIDVSGSMSWSREATLELIEDCPALTVAIYSQGNDWDGASRYETKTLMPGRLTILARNGRAVEKGFNYKKTHDANNWCDAPALSWLSRQPGPRVWFSDGRATGPARKNSIGGGHHFEAALTKAYVWDTFRVGVTGSIMRCKTGQEVKNVLNGKEKFTPLTWHDVAHYLGTGHFRG